MMVVIAPYYRDAQLWLRSEGMSNAPHHRIVTRPEQLQGLGAPLDVVWVNEHRWPTAWPDPFDQILTRVYALRGEGSVISERTVYV